MGKKRQLYWNRPLGASSHVRRFTATYDLSSTWALALSMARLEGEIRQHNNLSKLEIYGSEHLQESEWKDICEWLEKYSLNLRQVCFGPDCPMSHTIQLLQRISPRLSFVRISSSCRNSYLLLLTNSAARLRELDLASISLEELDTLQKLLPRLRTLTVRSFADIHVVRKLLHYVEDFQSLTAIHCSVPEEPDLQAYLDWHASVNLIRRHYRSLCLKRNHKAIDNSVLVLKEWYRTTHKPLHLGPGVSRVVDSRDAVATDDVADSC